MAPVLRTFISPEEIYRGRRVDFQEVAAVAARLNKVEALEFLAFLNLALSLATLEAKATGSVLPLRDVQTWVMREIVSQELLVDLRGNLDRASLLDRPMLHRTQLLFAIRVVATHGADTGGNMLEQRVDFDVVGDLLFLCNGLFYVDPASTDASKAAWLAAQLAPLHETENPREVALAWPRLTELLTRRLPSVASDHEALQRLERVAVFTSGFSLAAWIDLTFLLYAYWSRRTFRQIMTDRTLAYLGPGNSQEAISSDTLDRALRVLAVNVSELGAHLSLDSSHLPLFDITPFRVKPLWRLQDGRIFCVDAMFLLERLGPHLFWTAINSLDDKERRHQFSGLWGLAFEQYCLDAFERILPKRRWRVARNPVDDYGEEFWDCVAVRQEVAIVVECKGTFVTSAEKYSGDTASFFRGLTRKFEARRRSPTSKRNWSGRRPCEWYRRLRATVACGRRRISHPRHSRSDRGLWTGCSSHI